MPKVKKKKNSIIVLNQMRENKARLDPRKARREAAERKSAVADWKDKSETDSSQMATCSPRLIFKKRTHAAPSS